MEVNVTRMYKSKQSSSNFITQHILNNLNLYIKISIIFLAGIIVGIFFVKNISELQRQELSEYIRNFVVLLSENANIDYINLLKNSLLQNIIVGLLLWIIGSTAIGLPVLYLIILFKGFLLRIYYFIDFICTGWI